jgi:hypothetical protein
MHGTPLAEVAAALYDFMLEGVESTTGCLPL